MYTFDDFKAGRIGIRCDTREEYGKLMRMCEDAGMVWGSGDKPTQWTPSMIADWDDRAACIRTTYDRRIVYMASHTELIPFSALFLDPWADFLAGKCCLRVTKAEWAEFLRRIKDAGMSRGTNPCEWYWNGDRVEFELILPQGVVVDRALFTEKAIYDFSAIAPEPVKPIQKIIITAVGRVTTARLIEGKTTIKTATATCSQEDDFDFNRGAALACSRLTMTPEWSGWYKDKAAALQEVAEWLKGVV